MTKLVDEWLWIPYWKFKRRLNDRRAAAKNPKKTKLKTRLAMRRLRKRQKEESINDLIQMVYQFEVYHPTKPIRQYRSNNK
jgi:hypothetical protein